MISELLIANRGEIACRIIRTCEKLGIRSVVAYTQHDKDSLSVELADEAVEVPSYLDQEAIVHAAREAVHPGFGFLAENADFAQRCIDKGLVWVGPRPETIRALGSKERAKELAKKAGVPVLEGRTFPLMVKAAAGGGGKGMRRVEREEDLEPALASARVEAKSSFGDDTLLLEPLLVNPRHIEVQILGDKHGHVIHLGERECSIQRRHQKILEETPSARLPKRDQICEAALKLARMVGYENAGTVEFLVDEKDEFYFLEVNTRLQVEHPVTEMVTGMDLVEWQLRLACGEKIEWQPRFQGHAVEVRLYAEDPAQDYRPCPGPVLLWDPPATLRVETGLRRQDRVSSHYDPMIAKLIAHAPERKLSFQKLAHGLRRTRILGLTTNLNQLLELSTHPEVLEARVHTQWAPPPGRSDENAALAVAHHVHQGAWRNNGGPLRPVAGVQLEAYGAELTPPLPKGDYTIVEDETHWWVGSSKGATGLEKPRRAKAQSDQEPNLRAPLTGTVREILVSPEMRVEKDQLVLRLEAMKMEHSLKAPFSGTVLEVFCRVGETVEQETELLRLSPDPA